MWDWNNFVSGLIGALFGGGVTLLLAFVGRRDARMINVRTHTVALIEALAEAARVVNDDDIVDGTYQGRTAESFAAANRAIAVLGMVIRKKDLAVVKWASLEVGEIMSVEDVAGRVDRATVAAIRLSQWTSGRTKPAAFQAESDRILAANSAV